MRPSNGGLLNILKENFAKTNNVFKIRTRTQATPLFTKRMECGIIYSVLTHANCRIVCLYRNIIILCQLGIPFGCCRIVSHLLNGNICPLFVCIFRCCWNILKLSTSIPLTVYHYTTVNCNDVNTEKCHMHHGTPEDRASAWNIF